MLSARFLLDGVDMFFELFEVLLLLLNLSLESEELFLLMLLDVHGFLGLLAFGKGITRRSASLPWCTSITSSHASGGNADVASLQTRDAPRGTHNGLADHFRGSEDGNWVGAEKYSGKEKQAALLRRLASLR